jgi:hypothetical protein
MHLQTDRQTFRETVAQVAEQARAILPVSVNGRIESAVKLVLQGDVEPLDDGSIKVGSSDPTRWYHLVGTACTCTDFVQGKAPEGWCKHKIAANIQKSVERVLARTAAPVVPPELADWPLESDLPTMPAPGAPLGEAPASCNVYVMIGGHKVQVTLRDTDEHRMLARLTALLAQYPPAQAAPQGGPQASPAARPQPEPEEQRWCPKHGEKMQLNHKDGRSWWSHKTTEGWCRGK